MTTISAQRWRSVLEPGERILWEGKPGMNAPRRERHEFAIGRFVGIGLLGVILLWIVAASRFDSLIWPSLLAIAGFTMCFVGFGVFIWLRDKNRERLERIEYLLTDRRAMIFDGVTLSFPIHRDMPLKYELGNPPSIWFGLIPVEIIFDSMPFFGKTLYASSELNSRGTRKVGFAAIDDASRVMRLIREVQAAPPEGEPPPRSEALLDVTEEAYFNDGQTVWGYSLHLPLDAWDAILFPDEKILWEGWPDGRPRRDRNTIFMTFLGSLFVMAGVGMMWFGITDRNDAGQVLGMGAFASVFILAGIGAPYGARKGQLRRYENMHFRLTDRRALVFDGGLLREYPISPGMALHQPPGDRQSILFKQFIPEMFGDNDKVAVGFLQIADAPQVMDMIRRVQAGQAAQQQETQKGKRHG